MSVFASSGNGQFWYGQNGFLYKKNTGVGARRSTLFSAGGNAVCNRPQDVNNKYKPGGSGVGASSIANRRARNRLATTCDSGCGKFYNYLGIYNNNTGYNSYYNFLSQIEESTEGDEPIYITPSPIILNNSFTNSIYPLYGQGTFTTSPFPTYIKFSSSDTSLFPWAFSIPSNPIGTFNFVNIVQANSNAWFYNTSLNNTPYNNNVIALQGNSLIQQTLVGTIVNGSPYSISFYSANRSQNSTANYAQLFLTVSINGIPLINNFNPATQTWQFFSQSFIWTNGNITNPTITIQQTNTTTNDYSIFLTNPVLSQ